MEEAIQKANVLIEAMRWIRQFRDKVTVIKLGGSVMEDPDALRHLLIDIVFMETVGMRPIVVHGAGAAISCAMAGAGLEPRFIQGRRHTDDATLDIVADVLAGEVNEGLVRQIEELGGRADPLNFRTTPVLYGEQLQLTDNAGERIDLGHVGHVTRVDRTTLDNLCYAGVVPVIPSMCIAEGGEKLNVNADTAATAVAQTLRAEKLVFLSDVNGVRRDKDDADSLVHSLDSFAVHHRAVLLKRVGRNDGANVAQHLCGNIQGRDQMVQYSDTCAFQPFKAVLKGRRNGW